MTIDPYVIAPTPEEKRAALEALLYMLRSYPPGDIELTLRRQHHTHQASTIRSLKAILESYASADFDLRNEAAVSYCKLIKAAAKDLYIPFI